MTAQPDPQPVPDAVLTAALGGYYGHPTAITAADPDIVDGLTAGLAAGLASFDQRLRDVQDEYARAGASWDTTRDRLNGEIARLTGERDAAREANGRYTAAGARWQQRAEQLAAELEQWRACFGETALKDARGVLAERDRLRAADGRVRQALAKWDEDTVHDADALGLLLDDLRAALDPAPAAEQGQATLNREVNVQASAPKPEPAAEQDGGEPEEAKPRRVTSGAITNLMIYQSPPPSGYGPGVIGEAYRLGLRHGRGGL